jgi:hypothetical protein
MRCPGPVTRRVDPLNSADLMVAVAGIGALGIRAVLVRLDPTLSSLAPYDVLVVAPVDQCINFAARISAKQSTAFDALEKK